MENTFVMRTTNYVMYLSSGCRTVENRTMFDDGSDNNCSYISSLTANLLLKLTRVSVLVLLESNLKNSAIQLVEATLNFLNNYNFGLGKYVMYVQVVYGKKFKFTSLQGH